MSNKKLFKNKKKKNDYYMTVGELMKKLEKCNKDDVVILSDREYGPSPLDDVICSNLIYVPEDEEVGEIYLKEPDDKYLWIGLMDSDIEDDTGLGIVNAVYLDCK